jgi:hypothetical protein
LTYAFPTDPVAELGGGVGPLPLEPFLFNKYKIATTASAIDARVRVTVIAASTGRGAGRIIAGCSNTRAVLVKEGRG